MILWKNGRARTGCMSAVAMAPRTVLQSFIVLVYPIPPANSQGLAGMPTNPVLMFNTTLRPCHRPKKKSTVWAATPREAG